jgi:hypothetical protein
LQQLSKYLLTSSNLITLINFRFEQHSKWIFPPFSKNLFIQNRCLLHVYLQFRLWILGHNWSFQLNRLLAFFSKKNQREGEKRAQFKAFEPSEQKKIQKREKIIFSETNAYRLPNSVHYFIFAFFVTKNNDAILSFV